MNLIVDHLRRLPSARSKKGRIKIQGFLRTNLVRSRRRKRK